MQKDSTGSQIPSDGPLAILTENDATGEAYSLVYGGGLHLHKAYKIPIQCLHFNIENGRYATLFGLLTAAYPGVTIDPREERWRDEIIQLLNGTWEDKGTTGASTRQERPFFDQLVEDIKVRGQERPGVVIQNGAVMSGNRRLAALLTLHYARPDATQFQFFNAFIVPGNRGMTPTDRWRLEISQQMGQGRLMRDYTPANRLLKIREGVNGFVESGMSEDEALETVAFDFGSDYKTIREDLQSLRHIDDYLAAIGRVGAYWLINEKTETFTELERIENALRTNGMSLREKGDLKRSLYNLILNDSANHELMRKVRRAIGPERPRAGGRQPVPEAVKILVNASPGAGDLRKPKTQASQTQTKALAQNFESQIQAADDAEAPLIKAKRAETNLQAVAHSIAGAGGELESGTKSELESSLKAAERYIDFCLDSLKAAEQ